jgi:YidC/Oxa1 family membrane protein insertase
MDRTSKIGLVVCLLLLVVLQFVFDKYTPVPVPKKHVATAPVTSANAANGPAITSPDQHMTAAPSSGGTPAAAPAPIAPAPEKLSYLENDAMKLTLTSHGGAIAVVELKRHRSDTGGNVILNEDAHTNILALQGWTNGELADFDQQESIPNGIRYTTTLPNGLKWERTYVFGPNRETEEGLGGYLRVLFSKVARHLGQPESQPLFYTMDVSDKLTNPGTADVTLPPYSVSVGRAEPLYDTTQWSKTRSQAYSNAQYLGSGWLTGKFHLTTINDFNPGSFLGFRTREPKDSISTQAIDATPVHWIAVENQFFTVLLTPSSDRLIDHGEFHCYNERAPDGTISRQSTPDLEAAGYFPAVTVPPGQSVSLTYNLYAGPKDFNRLDALGDNQGELMNYDGVIPFSLLIVPMLTVLHFWYLILHNYGFAIILLTLMIKAVTWPLQSFANRSGKRMQALAPKLKEIQAKYKEQPEKLQTETFALYKDYGVNPFGGCLPAFIQMPVFFSLYYMLQNAVELRGQSFFWVHDLTKPDTVFSLPYLFLGFHPELHPLPIMVTLLTMIMMRMTPQIGDPAQAKIAQIMPLFFLFIFYNFAAALSLYYVVNNFVSIIQIYRNLKKPMPELKRKPPKGK